MDENIFNSSATTFNKSLIAVLQDAVNNSANLYRSVLLSDFSERSDEFWQYYIKVRSLYEEILKIKIVI